MKVKNNYLVVGVTLIPEVDEKILHYAKNISKILSLKIKLVHSLSIHEAQPYINYAGYPPALGINPIHSWAKIKSESLTRLSALAQATGVHAEEDFVLAEGVSEDCLIDEAKKCGAVLIVVGAAATRYKFVPSGFSVAISLLDASPLPVLVVNNESEVDLTESTLRMVIADDLGEFSESALNTCAAIAKVLPRSEIHHVHVTGSAGKLLLDTMKKYWETMGSLISTTIKPGDCYASDMESRQKDMEDRAQKIMDVSNILNTTYRQEILTGGTGKEIFDYAKEVNPHLMIFGQHHIWRLDKEELGSLKHWQMIEHSTLSLIMPNKCTKLSEHLSTHNAD
jgi:nucleotide-binding universal stress UspA family protein